MASAPKVLVVGATGMLGRPVVRRLVEEPCAVRALVRDPKRAGPLLPEACELVTGDLRDARSLERALAGVGAVYVNLAAPRSPRRGDLEREGVPLIVTAARRAGVRRLLKISFMGVPEAREAWWQAAHKAESEQAIVDSGLDYVIFRPTWLMESIPLFMRGRRLLVPRTPPDPVYWIAGDDYARQVAAALWSGPNRIYTIQGPEPLSFRQAADRFAAACRPPLRVAEIPLWVVRPLAPFSANARYLLDLLRVTFETNTRFDAQESWDDLGRPSMTIEDYVRYMERTGDVPRK